MDVNADFAVRAVVHGAKIPWVASPLPGVERRMLDRLGDEVARATTIVRYEPGSSFSPHVHTGGEEYLVIAGTFEDEHGKYPVGSYVRNPPQSRHTPSVPLGATILVKLWQFDLRDRQSVNLQTRDLPPVDATGREGVALIPLYHDAREDVRLEIWEPGAEVSLQEHEGLELFVLDGGFTESGATFAPQSWLRLPSRHPLKCTAGAEGARIWVKSDHLSVSPTRPRISE